MRAIIVIVVAAALIATGAALVLSRMGPQTPKALTPDSNMELLSFPPFELTSQDESPVTREIFQGRITIVDFFFSHCPFICPPMSRHMKMAQDALEGTGVRFLSISVDPEHDTPERLRAYAEEIGADTTTWTFATGDRETIRRILTDGLLLAAPEEDSNTPINLGDGDSMSNIAHPSHFILVGPNAEIISLTNGLDRDQVMRLADRAQAAARAMGGRP